MRRAHRVHRFAFCCSTCCAAALGGCEKSNDRATADTAGTPAADAGGAGSPAAPATPEGRAARDTALTDGGGRRLRVAFAEREQAGETIVVQGECPDNWVEVGDACLEFTFFDQIFGDENGEPEPPTPPGDGAPTAPPTKPTEAQCEAATERCKQSMRDAQEDCYAQAAFDAAKLANQNLTCFGNEKDVVESIDLTTLVREGIRTVERKGCTLGDLQPPPPDTATSPLGHDYYLHEFACQLEFRRIAMSQCIHGFHGAQHTRGGELSFQVNLASFAQFGLSGSGSVTIQVEPGCGARQVCAAAAQAGRSQCEQLGSQCKAKARGAALTVRPSAALDSILARIDTARLGLAEPGLFEEGAAAGGAIAGRFRALRRQPLEIDRLHEGRLRFLADWSDFLRREGITASAQARAQQAFERAQRSYAAVLDDYAALTIRAWVADPKTKKVGTPETHRQYRAFITGRALGRRGDEVEAALVRDLGPILRGDKRTHFRNAVWPGIHAFGAFQPMVPRQVMQDP